jgi:hypothetical protein
MGRAIEVNTTLQQLDMRHNWLSTDGGVVIASALRTNSTLVTVLLEGNGIGVEEGARDDR